MLALPTAQITVPNPLAEFNRARDLAVIIRSGAVITTGATVALGAELVRLREATKPAHGGDRKSNLEIKSNSVALAPEIPWRDLVAEQTGCSYEFCRRAEKVALDLAHRISGLRDKQSRRAKDLLTRADGYQWTADDYAALATVAGSVYDADTWHGILIETGILKPALAKTQNSYQLKSSTKLPLAEEARVFALSFLKGIQNLTAHKEQWRKRLAALPLDPTGDPNQPSLYDLREELKHRQIEIEEVIRRKIN